VLLLLLHIFDYLILPFFFALTSMAEPIATKEITANGTRAITMSWLRRKTVLLWCKNKGE